MAVAEAQAAVAEVAVIAVPHRKRRALLALPLVPQPQHPVLLLPVARLHLLSLLRHAVLHPQRQKLLLPVVEQRRRLMLRLRPVEASAPSGPKVSWTMTFPTSS